MLGYYQLPTDVAVMAVICYFGVVRRRCRVLIDVFPPRTSIEMEHLEHPQDDLIKCHEIQ